MPMTMIAGLQLIALLLGHGLGDTVLQPRSLSRRKRRRDPLGRHWWPLALSVHAAIHAALVALILISPLLGLAEFVCHWLTDWSKCERRISTRTDQAIHCACKLLWWLLALFVLY